MSEASTTLLMEKTWERIQRKTFTGWVNNHLRKRGLKIENIESDLSDGLLLIALLEIIADEPFTFKYEKKPKLRIQKVGNIGFCLKFIEQKGVKLANIGPEEIVDGNLKMVLGMIWTIILRFQIQDISLEELSARDALLLWCQRKTEGYPGVKVNNFHMSFQDGLAFCALIHRHRPDLLDYYALDRSDKAKCLQTAFDVAEKHLDIPKLLDVADMLDVPKPDERSVITYVSMYYHVFASSQKAEAAGKRVASVIEFNEANERIKNDYGNRARALVNWIDQTKATLDQRNFGNSLESVQQQIKEFNDYKHTQKAPKANDKVELESIFNALQTKLAVNNRPPFIPPSGLSPKDIDAAWALLEKSESERNKALREELRRQKRIKELVDRFTRKAKILSAWISGKEHFLTTEPLGDTISEVNARLKNHEGFESEFGAQKDSLSTLEEIAAELKKAGYHDIARISGLLADIKNNWGHLGTTASQRKANLEAKLAELLRIENLLLDFAKRGLALRVFLDHAEEDLTEPINVDTVESVHSLQKDFDALSAQIASKSAEHDALAHLAADCRKSGVSESTFSEVSHEELQQKWTNISNLVAQRRQQLQSELARQQNQDQLRRNFADQAKKFSAFVEQHSAAVGALSGDIDGQIAQLQQLTGAIAGGEPSLANLGKLDQQLVHAGIFDNQYTEATFESLKRDYDALSTLAKKKGEVLQKELALKSGSGLSPEQVQEFKECFVHFDKNHDQLLDRLEFGACLRSLGQEVSLEQGSKLDDIIKSIDGDGDGSVTFQEFLGYMEQISTVKDTPEDLKQAFKILAGDKDYVTEADLRAVLAPEKVAYCLQHMEPYPGVQGGYNYSSFSVKLYS